MANKPFFVFVYHYPKNDQLNKKMGRIGPFFVDFASDNDDPDYLITATKEGKSIENEALSAAIREALRFGGVSVKKPSRWETKDLAEKEAKRLSDVYVARGFKIAGSQLSVPKEQERKPEKMPKDNKNWAYDMMEDDDVDFTQYQKPQQQKGRGNNFFRQTSSRILQSHMVIFAFFIILAMTIIGLGLWWEDYSTSLLGYKMLPTPKANPWVIPLVALLPQIGSIGFAVIFLLDSSKKYASVISICLLLVDVFTDVVYKTSDFTAQPLTMGYAIAESLIIYTVGSEIMLAVCIPMLLMLFPHFAREFPIFLGRTFKSIKEGFAEFFEQISS